MSSNKLLVLVLSALVLGILFGWFFPGLMLAFDFVGVIFTNILQIIFIPLVASAIITGVAALSGQKKVAKAALTTITLFISTTIIAILIGLVLAIIFKPGAGVNTGAGFIPEELISAPVTQTLDFLSELAPNNILNAIMQGKFLGWMMALTIVAAILGTLGQKAKPVTDFFETVYAVVQKILGIIINALPIGIFFIVSSLVAHNSGNLGHLTGMLGKFSLVLLIGFLLHAIVVVPAVLKFYSGRSPFEYFKNVFPAIKTALATSSTIAALPVTYENSVERNKINNRIAALVLPIGSSLNVNGRAMYVTICALFVAQAFELNLGFTGIFYIAIAALFFSLGTATVPYAAMLALVGVFDAAGFPSPAYAGIGIVFVLDWFWGRVFAALDVWSNTAVAAAVEEAVVSERSIPEKRERFEREPQRRFERGAERRDFPQRQARDEQRRPAYRTERPERAPKPFTKPEREPVAPYKPAPKPDLKPERPRLPERSPSPFELKPETVKPFNLEAIKPAEPVAAKPPFPKREESETKRDDRRKVRERKHFPRGHDVDKLKSPAAEIRPEKLPVEDKPIPPVAPRIVAPRAVAPPPLIRHLETPKEKMPEPVRTVEPVMVEKLKDVSPGESEEMQTSLFGRQPHRKGMRPKSDEPPKPVAEAENFTNVRDFGRSARKKKPS